MRFLLLFLFSVALLFANVQTVKIGVLAKRGAAVTMKRWSSMAEYLSDEIPAYKFEIVPIAFKNILKEVEEDNVDFILANSGYYVVLERQYGAQRITTLVNKQVTGLTQKEFGGVIFTHVDNKDRFNTLESIKGSRFAAVNEKSLGGWQMTWREFVENDIDRDSDFSSLTFKGTHDKVVYSVLNKEEDVGTVRTDTLERMALENKIDLTKVHIVNPQAHDSFPFLISTKLYPEWPFAKLKHTSSELSKQVAIALMKMPADSKAAIQGRIAGWGTPLSYQPVHDCFRILQIPPYFQEIDFWDVLTKYWGWILFYLSGAVVGIAMLIYQFRLTNHLKETQNELVQTEKMASLGRLVAGIAHEVNTPIGIGVTAASHLKKEISDFNKEYKDESLTQSSFESFIDTSVQSSDIILSNLERAAHMIQNFKQVSVDQSSDMTREFFLKDYLESVVINLKPTLKQHAHEINIDCPETLMISSTPGVFYQIFSNLIMNSVIHGFEDKEKGQISITVHTTKDGIEIVYKDDGKGIGKEGLKKIFDPFYTTKRSSGGSGLGTHIIYNLVTQKLKGQITAQSHEGKDMIFIMNIKVKAHV
jgi:two-component system sensor histidine kinase TtrS